jgi:hypothetical protein
VFWLSILDWVIRRDEYFYEGESVQGELGSILVIIGLLWQEKRE